MKSTGIIRPVDPLGRVVLPIELRRTLGISTEDYLEVFVKDEYIMLKKYEQTCIFCGSNKDTQDVKGKVICSDCIREIRKL